MKSKIFSSHTYASHYMM